MLAENPCDGMTWESQGAMKRASGRLGDPKTLYSGSGGSSLGPPEPVSPWRIKQKLPEGQIPSFPISVCLAAGNRPITGRGCPLWGDPKDPETSGQDGTVSSRSESHLHALKSEQ